MSRGACRRLVQRRRLLPRGFARHVGGSRSWFETRFESKRQADLRFADRDVASYRRDLERVRWRDVRGEGRRFESVRAKSHASRSRFCEMAARIASAIFSSTNPGTNFTSSSSRSGANDRTCERPRDEIRGTNRSCHALIVIGIGIGMCAKSQTMWPSPRRRSPRPATSSTFGRPNEMLRFRSSSMVTQSGVIDSTRVLNRSRNYGCREKHDVSSPGSMNCTDARRAAARRKKGRERRATRRAIPAAKGGACIDRALLERE